VTTETTMRRVKSVEGCGVARCLFLGKGHENREIANILLQVGGGVEVEGNGTSTVR